MTEKFAFLSSLMDGKKKMHIQARQVLPILVRWAESQANLPIRNHKEHTYLELAKALDPPTHQRVVPRSLGLLGYALDELSKRGDWNHGRIPPIQLLVWTQGKGHPGDSGFAFLDDVSRENVKSMGADNKRRLALGIWQEVVKYSNWQEVLKACGLQPISSKLPDIENAVRLAAEANSGREESPAHKKLKMYVKEHFQLLGIDGQFESSVERLLLSADRVDVLLDEKGKGLRTICIEVKSKLSPYGDLIRGLFQCVKYRAILRAHNTYQVTKSSDFAPRNVEVMLVVESPLPADLQRLSLDLDIPVRELQIPN